MFHGSMVALVTPMDDDGNVNFEALERLIEFHVENATDAIVAVGTTGCDVVLHVVKFANDRVPIIAGTGSNCTREAIKLTRCAMEAGADACLLVAPYYNKPSQEGIYLHYKAVAEAVPIPQILYNVPGRTVCDIMPETVARLADISNIIGIKEATGSVTRAQDIMALCGDKLDIYSGDDATALALMLAGAKGDISVTANVAPRDMHDMCVAAINGERSKAQEINDRLMVLHRGLFVEANPMPVKWALHQMGMIPQGLRLPLTPLAETHYSVVSNALKNAGIIGL